MRVARLTQFADEWVFFHFSFEANEMACLLNKFVLFTNQKQSLKYVRQSSYIDLWSNTLNIIWQGVHLLVKLQARGCIKVKSLTSISLGFGKCTKSTLWNNYFAERLPVTASAFKLDHDIIVVTGAECFDIKRKFWY